MPDSQTRFFKDEKVTVTTTVLQIFGSSSWGTAVEQPQKLYITVTNLGSTALYIRRIVHGAGVSMTGLVSSTDYSYALDAGASQTYECSPEESLLVIRGSGSGDVRASGVQVINYA